MNQSVSHLWYLLFANFSFGRSGKSSIKQVVFYKMSPHETNWLVSMHSLGMQQVDGGAVDMEKAKS